MRTAMGLKLPDGEVHPAVQKLIEMVVSSDEYAFQVANKALLRCDFSVLDVYKKGLQQYYSAELQQADFGRDGPAIQESVNRWANHKTKGKIPSLLDQPPQADTALVLLNAAYFKGAWETPFEEANTKPSTFYNRGSKATKVPMMRMTKTTNFTVSKELKSMVLELPYLGDHLSMIFVLPDERNGLQDLEKTLTAGRLQTAVQSLACFCRIDIMIPVFKLEHKYELVDVLKLLGIKEAFDVGEI